MSKGTQPSSTGEFLQMVQLLPSSEQDYKRDNPDILQFLLSLTLYWKNIIVATLIGTLCSLALALYLPKTYHSSANVAIPSISETVKIEEGSLLSYSPEELFYQYYKTIRSQGNFRQYLIENDYLNKFYPQKYNEVNADEVFSSFVDDFSVDIIDDINADNGYKGLPSLFSVSLEQTNESLVVELINGYLIYANNVLVANILKEQQVLKELKIIIKQNELKQLRAQAKTVRELTIEKIEFDNQQLINELQQEKSLIIAKAAADRATDIALAEEAFNMAKSLNIVTPTRLDNLSDTNVNSKTNITLSDRQTLPLYLMGTMYLDTFVKSLRARKNDEPFLEEVNEINFKISTIVNDQKLATLKLRKSDDAYIENLPQLLSDIASLQSKNINFNDVMTYSLEKPAIVTNQSIKPKRALIVILGAMLSGLIALMAALFLVAINARKEQEV